MTLQHVLFLVKDVTWLRWPWSRPLEIAIGWEIPGNVDALPLNENMSLEF